MPGWDKDLPVKGVLLAGVPGGGKSLTAKAAAGVLGTTLVRLDTVVSSGKNWVSQCTSRGLRAALRAKCSKTMPIATPIV
ncbi:AAA family ATPase [Escherichia coli]|uniref:AAA family ATPase n=1 Tax=Escherichia coli TaxID=562 RepID=UPI00345B9D35